MKARLFANFECPVTKKPCERGECTKFVCCIETREEWLSRQHNVSEPRPVSPALKASVDKIKENLKIKARLGDVKASRALGWDRK
jgi:hypothetical protein